MKVAVIQLASGPVVESNLQEVKRLARECALAGAGLVVLPENFACMGNQETDKLAIAESHGDGPIQNFVSELASELNLWIVAGTVPIKSQDPQRVYASCLVYDATGKPVVRYDKAHLFDVRLTESGETYLESETIAAGHELAWFDSPFGRVGLAVCYDLRFPEMFRNMVNQGVEIFVIPSAFTATTGRAHWEILLRARAVENLSYIMASNQGGYHVSGRETYGNSMIVNPWGEIQSRMNAGSGFVVAELDRQRLATLRETFPVLKHQRFQCGKSE